MFRTALAAAFIAVAPAAVFAETLLVAAYSPRVSSDELLKLLAEPGERGTVETLVQTPTGVSVHKVVLEQDLGRASSLYRHGLVGHELTQPDPCAFDIEGRDDEIAVVLQKQVALVEAVKAGRLELAALEQELKGLDSRLQALSKDVARAEENVTKTTKLHSAAHEAAHVQQQQAKAARQAANKTKLILFEIIALHAELLYEKARVNDVALEEVLANAVAERDRLKQDFGQVQADRDKTLRRRDAVRGAIAENTKAAEAVREQASVLAFGGIVTAAVNSVKISLDLETQYEEATALAYEIADFAASQGNKRGYISALAVAEALEDGAEVARAETGFAILLGEQAKRLGPVPPAGSAEEAEKLPHVLLLKEIELAADVQAALRIYQETGNKGENPLYEGKSDLRAVVEDSCPRGDCVDKAEELLDRLGAYATLQLQQALQNQSQHYQALSNVLKTRHDTTKNSISNIR
jgi:hypothetical protein